MAASPHREAYEGEHWSTAIAALRQAAPSPAAATALAHPYFSGTAPCTMLIDEVEAVWAPIAEADDWSALHGKIVEVREAGAALAPLHGAGPEGFLAGG
jgi:hypothetical protein